MEKESLNESVIDNSSEKEALLKAKKEKNKKKKIYWTIFGVIFSIVLLISGYNIFDVTYYYSSFSSNNYMYPLINKTVKSRDGKIYDGLDRSAYAEGDILDWYVANTHINVDSLKRFNVVVMNSTNDVMRVMALPNEVVEYTTAGELLINDKVIDQPFLATGMATIGYPIAKKTLQADEFILMHDNRNAQSDSRA